MVNLGVIIALSSMTFVLGSHYDELHSLDEK